jgi:hypothetical protein
MSVDTLGLNVDALDQKRKESYRGRALVVKQS